MEITCVGCRKNKEVTEVSGVQGYIENGYSILWDISSGLTDLVFCEECTEKLRESIEDIEKIVRRRIDDINFTGF